MVVVIHMLRLKSLREDKDLKQSDVAKLLNVSQVSYGRYELGLSEPSIDSLIKLADFYNVSLDYLVGRDIKIKYTSLPKEYVDNLIEIVDEIKKIVRK